MTEGEWLASWDRQPMLEAFRDKISDRKLRLFACACCRRIWHFLTEDSRTAVIVAERYADGNAGRPELGVAQEQAIDAARNSDGEAAWFATDGDAFQAAFDASYCAAGREACLGWPGRNDHDERQVVREHAESAELLRDIFGNPFRPLACDPTWLTSDVVALAAGIYQDRAFDRMPILADALMDAGCASEAILNHCRGPGPHVRGCWVIDLLLGRE